MKEVPQRPIEGRIQTACIIPFSQDEEQVMRNLIEAHNRFLGLLGHHPHDIQEWVHSLHALQNILMSRVAARDYPSYFRQGEGDHQKQGNGK